MHRSANRQSIAFNVTFRIVSFSFKVGEREKENRFKIFLTTDQYDKRVNEKDDRRHKNKANDQNGTKIKNTKSSIVLSIDFHA